MKAFSIVWLIILFSCTNKTNEFCIVSIKLERFYEAGPSPDLITVRLNNFDKEQIKNHEKSFNCVFYKNGEKLFSTIDCGFETNAKGDFLNINTTYFIQNKISDTLSNKSILKDKIKMVLINDLNKEIILETCF